MKDKGFNKNWIYLIIVAFGFVLYGNSLTNDYALDDAIVISQNEFTKQGVKGIGEIFKHDSFVGFWKESNPQYSIEQIKENKKLVAGGRYRPLSLATFAIEYDVFGNNPMVFHLMNVLIYILSAVVLCRFLSLLFEDKESAIWRSLPFVTVLLFMAHPLHTEVVANIKGRDELLSFLGTILAALMYVKYVRTHYIKYGLLIPVFMFLALLSKENAITWLAIIPVVTWFFVDSDLKKQIFPFMGLVMASVVFVFIRHSVLGLGAVGKSEIAPELMNNPFLQADEGQTVGTILYTFWVYLKLLVVPHPLTYDYYPYHIELIDVENVIPLAMLIIYAFLLVFSFLVLFRNFFGKTGPNAKLLCVVVLMYLAPLSVVSNVFFPVGVFMAERFLYFSSLAYVLLLAWIFTSLFYYVKEKDRQKNLLYVLFFLILTAYTVKTIDRNMDWKDDFTLFTTDVKTSANSAKANTTAGGKMLEKASDMINPKSDDYDPNLANEYVDQAIVYLNKAVKIHPDYADPKLLLGNAYYQKNKDIATAVHWYAELLKMRPYHELAVKNTKVILPQLIGLFANGEAVNTPDEIINACLEFDSVKKGVPEVYRTVGLMYARYKNDFQTAIPYYQKALRINPKDVVVWKDLGVIYGQSGMFEEALNAFMKVHEQYPDDAQVVFNISVSYQNLGRLEDAKLWFAKYREMMAAAEKGK